MSAKGKRIVRAWAVVNADGRITYVSMVSLAATQRVADYVAANPDWYSERPHTVVPLVGEWKPPVKAKRKDCKHIGFTDEDGVCYPCRKCGAPRLPVQSKGRRRG